MQITHAATLLSRRHSLGLESYLRRTHVNSHQIKILVSSLWVERVFSENDDLNMNLGMMPAPQATGSS
jgi:hypothetical protein